MNWKTSPERKPLLLQGARQVGKTYLMEQFSDSYENAIYCNFEEDPSLAELFNGRLKTDLLIEQLAFYANKPIHPEKTLIIFDEIQLAQRAMTSLKYFYEQANQYHIIAAGSLLGVSIGQQAAFPVGKVTFMDLYPLNFIEYLMAIGETMLAEMLLDKQDFAPIATPLHEKLMHYFKIFLYLGGMPEVVDHYVKHQDITQVQVLQKDIHKAYANDFSKYAEPHESMKISAIWQNIPSQLAKENKKFKFTQLEKNARYSRYEFAIEWLRKANLIYLAKNVTTAKAPLAGYSEPNHFKLFYLDTGLLISRLNAPSQLLTSSENLYTEYQGALIKNYVAKEIYPMVGEYLHYWTSKSAAEVDFVIEHQGQIYPVEVKSGYSKHKKSLISFDQKYQPPFLLRFSPRNFQKDNKFINIPLYAACILQNLLNN